MSFKDEVKKQVKLIKLVFGSPEGRDLLDILASMSKIEYTPDTNEQYYRLGRYHWVNEIIQLVDARITETRELTKSEVYDQQYDERGTY